MRTLRFPPEIIILEFLEAVEKGLIEHTVLFWFNVSPLTHTVNTLPLTLAVKLPVPVNIFPLDSTVP